MITELRRYRIDPDRLESWLAFFREALREHGRRGMRVEYAGVDRETSTLVWMRSFASEAERQMQKDAFYGSDWWNERESFAMGHVLEYEVTFLEAVAIRDGGEVIDVPVHDAAERPGARRDPPPAGWLPSTGQHVVRAGRRPPA